MNDYLLKDYWGQLVTQFKDQEREDHGRDGYATETLALDILDWIRFSRIRQWTLFTQKRGEEFEAMLAKMETRGHPVEAVQRFLEEEERWTTTLKVSEL